MPSTLELSRYKPNFNDPRTRKRALSVLEWCASMRLSKQTRTVHHDQIREIFGNTGKGLAKWLFANLLTRSGHYVAGKRSFSYKLKISGYEKVHKLLELEPPTDVEVAMKQFGDLIAGVEAPMYSDKGERRYHPVQNIKREIKWQAFAGWWDYDIESCAPTLVYQYAVQRYGAVRELEIGQPFPAVAKYIHEKVTVRKHVAQLTRLDLQNAKELVNAMFFRANLAPSHKAAVFQLLGCDPYIHQRLVNDQLIKEFRRDVKEMWRWAELHDFYERGTQLLEGKGLMRRPVKAAKHRMAIYLRLERTVIDAMTDKLANDGVPVILMHDGFMSRKRIAIHELAQVVKNKTGFDIRLSESLLGDGVADVDVDFDVVDLLVNDAGEADDELAEQGTACPQ